MDSLELAAGEQPPILYCTPPHLEKVRVGRPLYTSTCPDAGVQSLQRCRTSVPDKTRSLFSWTRKGVFSPGQERSLFSWTRKGVFSPGQEKESFLLDKTKRFSV